MRTQYTAEQIAYNGRMSRIPYCSAETAGGMPVNVFIEFYNDGRMICKCETSRLIQEFDTITDAMQALSRYLDISRQYEEALASIPA